MGVTIVTYFLINCRLSNSFLVLDDFLEYKDKLEYEDYAGIPMSKFPGCDFAVYDNNNELSYSITDQPSFIICDVVHYSDLNTYSKTVDITKLENFTEGDLDEHSTGACRFSGWSQTGNITFTKDTPRVTEITGTWNWVDMVKYSYSWNAPSYSDLTGLVTLPTGGSAYVGETVSVDTKYNSDSKVEVLKWTEFTGLDDYCLAVCYGNGRFIITGNNSNK